MSDVDAMIPGTDGASLHSSLPTDSANSGKSPSRRETSQVLCDAPNGVGGNWATDDTIYFGSNFSSGLTSLPVSLRGEGGVQKL
jgi:hypothetical protein